MKIKTQILILILLTSFGELKSQDSTILLNNYESYISQATEMKYGLKMRLNNGAIDSITPYLNIKFVIKSYKKSDTIRLLNNQEKTLIGFFSKDYNTLLQDILGKEHYYNFEYTRVNRYSDYIPQLNYELKDFWIESSERVLSQIEESSLSESDKTILSNYWKNAINKLYGFPFHSYFNQDSLNKISTELIDNSSDTTYNYFIKNYLRYRYTYGDWGIGADITPFGYAKFTNDLSDYFINGFAGGVNIDISKRKWIYNIKLYGFNADINKNITYKSDWNTTGRIFSFNAGLNIGYSILDNNRFRITPTGGLGIGGIRYIEGDSTIEKTNALIQPNLAMIIDLKFNIPVKRYREKHKSYYGADKEVGYWYLRFYGGCHPLGFNNKFEQNGSIWYFNIGLGGFISPPKRLIE
ncbi:hypothetical protein ERX46_16965 [Brumimicrobium glaciale]|uniref:DUF3575 domain-containing protein n=1 Tax=Brumimicrobium glaciale TaxID=200475 RepID=A0A4Q4KCN5_9FLAO|nr:hypothetical protein [Brumimicrobium glaciale]RYM30771.1 hypothetical protein ERX46_16965 [Brumimicrobium glaciale]